MFGRHIHTALIGVMLFGLTNANGLAQDAFYAPETLFDAETLHDIEPDTARVLYQKAIEGFDHAKDTTGMIRSKIGLSDLYKNDGFYHSAFDELWDAQIFAEALRDTLSLIKLNRDLGSLYSIYQKYEEALAHFQTSLHYTRHITDPQRLAPITVSQIYYSFAVTHRKAGAYETALIYLDSCLLAKQIRGTSKEEQPYVLAEKGIIFLKTGRLDEAQKYLEIANAYFSQRNMDYRIFTNLFLGDFYLARERYRKANAFYRQSLISQENSPSHGDSKVEILKKLADSYWVIGEQDSAYIFQGLAISLTDSLFNARTAVNSQLFRIRDKHDELIRAKNEHISQQQLIIERDKVIALRLKLFIGVILLVGVGLTIFLMMRRKIQAFQQEKARLKTQALHDREKAHAVMEVKSRELTANTLQLIEKDRIIEALLEELQHTSPSAYHKLKKQVTKGNRDMWERFEKRFIEVDTHFYTRLREKHPTLTPTEHRHCALIKLGFDSKEMASLLGISLNSVHISRHRIRKKMGLERKESLGGYIGGI